MSGLFKRALALVLSGALVWMAPGLGAYQALAQTRGGEVAEPVQAPLSAGLSGREAIPDSAESSWAAPLPLGTGDMTPTQAPGAVSLPDRFSPVSLPRTALSAVLKSVQPRFGLMRILLERVAPGAEAPVSTPGVSAARSSGPSAPRASEPPPEENPLAPSRSDLAGTESSREWAERAFAWLKGEPEARIFSTAAPVFAGGRATASFRHFEPPFKSFLAPFLQRGLSRIPPAPGPASPRPSGAGLSGASLWKVVLGAALLGVPLVRLASSLAIYGTLGPHFAGDVLHTYVTISYVLSNTIGFVYAFPQIYRIYKSRSASSVSFATLAIGVAGSGFLAFNAAYNHAAFWAYQNMAGTLGFGANILQKWRYDRRPLPPGERTISKSPSLKIGRFRLDRQALGRTVLSGLAVAAVTLGLGAGFLAWVPSLSWAASLIVPFQLGAAVGFAYLMFPQYIEIERNRSVGDVSRGTALSFLVATMAIGIWGFDQLVRIPSGSPVVKLGVLGAYLAVLIPVATAALHRISRLRWNILPARFDIWPWVHLRQIQRYLLPSGLARRLENWEWRVLPKGFKSFQREFTRDHLAVIANFALLSAFMLSAVGLGYGLMVFILPVPPDAHNRFFMFLLYLVENVISALATGFTLRAMDRYRAPLESAAVPEGGASPSLKGFADRGAANLRNSGGVRERVLVLNPSAGLSWVRMDGRMGEAVRQGRFRVVQLSSEDGRPAPQILVPASGETIWGRLEQTLVDFLGQSAGESGAGPVPADMIPPGTTLEVLDTLDEPQIGRALFADLAQAVSVDAAMYSFTNFNVDGKSIQTVLQQIKDHKQGAMRFVVDFSQSKTKHAFYPILKQIADEAYRIAGKGGTLDKQTLAGIMHLKLWLIRRQDGKKVLYVGSANASAAASGSQAINYETLLRFVIPGEAQNSVFDVYEARFEELLKRAKQFDSILQTQGEDAALKFIQGEEFSLSHFAEENSGKKKDGGSWENRIWHPFGGVPLASLLPPYRKPPPKEDSLSSAQQPASERAGSFSGEAGRAPPGEKTPAETEEDLHLTRSPPDLSARLPASVPAAHSSPSNKNKSSLPVRLYEAVLGFLGFRILNGVIHNPNLARRAAFNASADKIVGWILEKYEGKITPEQFQEFSGRYGVDLSDRRGMLRIRDRLERLNFQQFSYKDSKKYETGGQEGIWGWTFLLTGLYLYGHGWGLAALIAGIAIVGLVVWRDKNILFREGAGLPKRLVDLAFRFPYRLFDMFFFGYFRRNISYHFFHPREDFLSLSYPGSVPRFLEQAFREAGLNGAGRWTLDHPVFLAVERYLWFPLFQPLFQFGTRRTSLAFFASIGMGVLGGFSPFLPMGFKLTSVALPGISTSVAIGLGLGGLAMVLAGFHGRISSRLPRWSGRAVGLAGVVLLGLGLGPTLTFIAYGVPVALSQVPWAGGFLASLSSTILHTLLKDMVLGPMLNTAILSTLLTFPRAVWQEVIRQRHDLIAAGSPPPVDLAALVHVAAVAVGTFFDPRDRNFYNFWKQNAVTFVGLMTVGAEIAGIMGYMAGVDAALSHWVGHRVSPFQTIGAAIERPSQWRDEGHLQKNLIPFGGAITWGNVLLYKLESAAGFNLSDHALNLTSRLIQSAHPNPVSESLVRFSEQTSERAPAAQGDSLASRLIHESAGAGDPADSQTISKDQTDLIRRMADAVARSGKLKEEIGKTEFRIRTFQNELTATRNRLREVRSQADPIPESLRRRYLADIQALKAKRDQLYLLSKLAQKTDLKNPALASEQLKGLEELLSTYQGLGPKPEGSAYLSSRRFQLASLRALDRSIALPGRPQTAAQRQQPASNPADVQRENDIAVLVARIQGLQAMAQTQVAERDAAGRVLAAVSQARSQAVGAHRSMKERMEFRKNFAQWAVVTDFSFAMNKIHSAETAFNGMLQLLSNEAKRVDQQRQINNQNLQSAQSNLDHLSQWQQQAQGKIDQDNQWLSDLTFLKQQADTASSNVGALQNDVQALLATINSRDKGSSPDAPAEYQRRLGLMGPVTTPGTLGYQRIHGYSGGDANNLNRLSMAQIQAQLTEVNKDLVAINNGQAKLDQGVPVQAVGAVMREVLSSHWDDSRPLMANLLNAQAYWQQQLQNDKQLQTSVKDMLDPNFSGTTVDDFGDSRPTSLVKYRAQVQADTNAAQSQVQAYTARMDALARDMHQKVPSINLPTLSGKTPQELRTLLEDYFTQIESLSYPNTNDGNLAKLDKILLGDLLAQTGDATVRWLVGQHTLTALTTVQSQTVPAANVAMDQVVPAVQSLVDLIAAYIAFANQGSPPDSRAQAVLDQTKQVVENILRPALVNAQGFIQNTLVPYQQGVIDLVDPSKSDNLVTLYQEKLKLYNDISTGYYKDAPWGLASAGAPLGNVQQALANIAALQAQYDGYKTRVRDLLTDVSRREDKDGTENGTEDVYGETMPYSIPKRLAKYQAEKIQRTQEINSQDVQVNEILTQIDQRTNSQYRLAAQFKLPENISATDPASVTLIKNLLQNNQLTDLANQLKTIADQMQAQGGSVSLDSGGNGLGTGTQQVQLNNQQMVALLALEAAKRLAPTTQQAASGSVSFSMIRFLFSDGVASSAQDVLKNQLPVAETFLTQADGAIAAALADLQKNVAYVRSNPPSETASQVYSREVGIYNQVGGVAGQGLDFFGQKKGWDQGSLASLSNIQKYYQGLVQIYTSGNAALDGQMQAIQAMKQAIQGNLDEVEKQKKEIQGWLSQLNDPHDSAMRRVADSLSAIQEKTRAVLQANIHYHDVKSRFDAAQQDLDKTLRDLDRANQELAAKLKELPDLNGLSPELASRIETLSPRQGAWLMPAGTDQPEVLVVRKSQFDGFLTRFLSVFEPASSSGDIRALKQQILDSPEKLASLIPNSVMLQSGGDDGFYLFYQSQFSVPYGLQTQSEVTLGNVARIGGQNLSLTGYRMGSPPSPSNAPWGDQGMTVTVESLQGAHWVNYGEFTLHRFIQDIPSDIGVASQARQDRLMILDDFALLLVGDRLYIGGIGFGDFSAADAGDRPYYYGGNLKTSVELFKTSAKFIQAARLTAEEAQLFVKDPRRFMETVNLDFTGFNQDLNQDFVIRAQGRNAHFERDKAGVELDLPRSLTVDFFLSRIQSSDDISQDAAGITVLKGFSIAGDNLRGTSRTTAELGQRFNTLSQTFTFDLPRQGIAISAQGQVLGDASAYYIRLSKKVGANSTVDLSYGSPYVGMRNRLSLGTQTSFTLGGIWRSALERASENLEGGRTLARPNNDLRIFFDSPESHTAAVQELKRVYERSIARQLLTQKIGEITRQVRPLVQAGAVAENTHIRAMVGFVSNAVGTHASDRAVGGGPQSGAVSELSLTRSQKALIENRSAQLAALGLDLESVYLDLTRQFQQAVVDLARARWDLTIADAIVENSQNQALRAEAVVHRDQARAELRQAVVRYNSLTGRGPSDTFPKEMEGLTSKDVSDLMRSLEQSLRDPERVTHVFRSLNPQELNLPQAGFNVVDWIPFLENMTFYFGIQLQDFLGNQAFGFGISATIPVYDPASKEKDKALRLENQAVLRQVAALYNQYYLRAVQARTEAQVSEAQRQIMAANQDRAARDLSEAVAAYRNGLIGQSELRQAFEIWRWYTQGLLSAQANEALQESWAGSYLGLRVREAPIAGGPPGLSSPLSGFMQAVRSAQQASADVGALALRSEAASHRMKAVGRRLSQVSLDLHLGYNLTSSGVAWLPAVVFSGLGSYPVLSFDLSPNELKELSARGESARGKLYHRLQDKVEVDLAIEVFQNYAAYQIAGELEQAYQTEIIPELEAAKARAEQGGDRAAAEKASWDLDQARMRLVELNGERQELQEILNFLAGRPMETPIRMDEDLEQAWSELSAYLNSKNPLQIQTDILASRVEVAQTIEQVVDGRLKPERVRTDIAGLVGRQVTRLLNAWTGPPTASTPAAQTAREETLEAQRQRDEFEQKLPVQRAQVRRDLALARQQLGSLEGREDAQSRILRLGLENTIYLLESQLGALGGESGGPLDAALAVPSGGLSMPSSYAELRDRLIQSQMAQASPDPSVRQEDLASFPTEPDGGPPWLGSYVRYYHLRTSLGRDPIHKDYRDTWFEARLKSPTTPSSVLVTLSRFQQDKQDQLYRATLADARVRAEMLLYRFQTNVDLMRQAQRAGASQELGGLKGPLEKALSQDGVEISVDLGLPAQTSWRDLANLVPQDSGDILQSADRFLGEEKSLSVSTLRHTIFQGGLPDVVAHSEDDEIGQLSLDMIARQMSYHGFTPVAAYGIFRGHTVSGSFLEAPDPEQIQKGLENVLGDALTRELRARGEFQALTLRLYSLMVSVEDKARLVGEERDRVAAAEDNYRSQTALLERGMAKPEDVLEAQQGLSRAWAGFTDTLTGLRLDFIELVSELEAIGAPAKASGNFPAAASSASDFTLGSQALRQDLVSYWADRMLDPRFAGAVDKILSRSPEISGLRADLKSHADTYRQMAEDAEHIRYMDFTPREKLDLLTRADVQGRRINVQRDVEGILAALGGMSPDAAPLWGELFDFIKTDLKSQEGQASQDLERPSGAYAAMRQAYWHATPAGWGLEGAFDRLDQGWIRTDQARQALLEQSLSTRQSASEFIMRDILLDQFLKDEIAYDQEVIRTFNSPELKNNPQAAGALDQLFDLRESVERQRDLLSYGRGMLAIRALIDLGNARLQALKWRLAGPEDISQAATTVRRLEELRDRWRNNPRELEPLYAVTNVDGQGNRTWSVEGWLTPKDLESLERSGRVVSIAGRMWLLPEAAQASSRSLWTVEDLRAAKAQEILSGIDLKAAHFEKSRSDLDQNARSREVFKRLENADFVLISPGDGSENGYKIKPESYQDVYGDGSLADQGRIFYFSNKAEAGSGLHPALHPLLAGLRSADSYTAYVYLEKGVPARDRYPSLESLTRSEEFLKFALLQAGPKGVEAMTRQARANETLAERAGWIYLKLHAYAFQLDSDDRLVQVYLTPKEYDKARDRVRNAGTVHNHRFFLSRQIQWELDGDGNLLSVSAPEDGGQGKSLTLHLGQGGPVARRVGGHVFAVELNSQDQLAQVFQDRSEVGRKAKGWILQDLNGSSGWNNRLRSGPTQVRLRQYVDPGRVDPRTHEPTPVVLSREYLLEHLERAQSLGTRSRRWAYSPIRWPTLLTQVPRGVVETFTTELPTGRDMNQEGYIGRVYMMKSAGGDTADRGILLGAVYFVNNTFLLGLAPVPDHVSRYLDPSQFPSEVTSNGPVLPGEWIFQKDLTAMIAGSRRRVHFGAGSAEEMIRYAQEDLAAARSSAVGYFEGDVHQEFSEIRRGRSGIYHDSRVEDDVGPEAMDRVLSQWGGLVDGSGRADLSADPNHIEVQRVEDRVLITPGARQYQREVQSLSGLPQKMEERRREAEAAAPGLERIQRQNQQELQASQEERDQVRSEERGLADETHRLGWRIGREQARLAEIARLQGHIEDLNQQLGFERAYLKRLRTLLGHGRGGDKKPNPPPPQKPIPEPGWSRLPFWKWVFLGLGVGVVLCLISRIFRSRK